MHHCFPQLIYNCSKYTKKQSHPATTCSYQSSISWLTSTCFYSDKLHVITLTQYEPVTSFVPLFLSGEDVFIFSRCSESSMTKGSHTVTTTRGRITVKAFWNASLGWTDLTKSSYCHWAIQTLTCPSVLQVLAFGPPYGQKALKAIFVFVFIHWSVFCNYLSKWSILTLHEKPIQSLT